MDLQGFIILGVLVESIGESVWWLFPDSKGERGWSRERLLALVLGGIFAVATGLNLLDAAGLSPADYMPAVAWQVIGIVSTALVGMRGATAVHDLLGIFSGWRAKMSA